MTAAAFGAISPAVVDHLQRVDEVPPFDPRQPASHAPPASRRLSHIRGVSSLRKPGVPGPEVELLRPPTERLLAGLAGYGIPVAFHVVSEGGSLSAHLGTWSSATGENASQPVLDARQDVVLSLLRGLYPTVDAVESIMVQDRWPLGGLALGTPRDVAVDPTTGANAINHLARSMAGQRWAVLVLAQPVSGGALAAIRRNVVEEIRAASATQHHEGVPNPLVRHYTELLTSIFEDLTAGQATGAWRTSVYLLGDEVSYPSLASAWPAVFAGGESLAEPVRVHDIRDVSEAAGAWLVPDAPGLAGPTGFAHPYGAQSLLTSEQLAHLVQLPRLEVHGFEVSLAPAFDVMPPASRDDAVLIGSVLKRGKPIDAEYRVSLARLTRHAFVAGVTGSGKTNTMFHVLSECHERSVPFLVLEPAKREYRALLDDAAMGSMLRVFTVGDERVSPIRLNPFEVPAGTSVAEHLDLLRAAFGASFGMWTPLPQVLERCLHEIYVDRGWDLRTSLNRRVGPGEEVPAEAFPTLSQLVAKVSEVVPTLGYDHRVTADLGAALTTRLESLRRGGKGAMLDVERSTPAEELFGGPCVLELESVGDDGDKAFLMAMVLILMAEHRRARGMADGLVHLLVVEEAHRVLSAGPRRLSEEMADPRGQAVETFVHLLAEVRAYGQGLVIVDQVPNRLAPEVLKNTGLKVAHRVVAADDRAALGATMVMDEDQERALAILDPGQAAVFSEGADAPVLVQVPLVKAPATLAHAEVAARMHARAAPAGSGPGRCLAGCGDEARACEVGRLVAGEELVQRVVGRIALSAVLHDGAVDRLWGDLVTTVAARRPPDSDMTAVLASVCRHGAGEYAERRAAHAGWGYGITAELAGALRDVLLEKLAAGERAVGTTPALARLRTLAMGLHAYDFPPYSGCARIGDGREGGCPFRWAAADLVGSGRYRAAWRSADEQDSKRDDAKRPATWNVCQDGAYDLVEFPQPDSAPELSALVKGSAQRAALCFAQQMLADDPRKLPRTSGHIMQRLFEEAGL